MKRPSKTENGPRKQRSDLNSQKFASNLQQASLVCARPSETYPHVCKDPEMLEKKLLEQ